MSNDNPLLVRLCQQAHADPAVKALGCSGCVKYFASKLGIPLPDKQANDPV